MKDHAPNRGSLTAPAPTLDARVTRYILIRIRIGQALLPAAAIANVLVRRAPSVVSTATAVVFVGGALVVLVSAWKRLGWQPLRFEHGALVFGETGVRAAANAVSRWTYHGGVARLYGTDVSFRLQARSGGEEALKNALRRLFGVPLELERRGSPRARVIALTVALFGAVSTGFGIAYSMTLVLIGVPCFAFGAGALGALSQRVRRR